MSRPVELGVKPTGGSPVPAVAGVTVEVVYEVADLGPDDRPTLVQRSVRFQLDAELQGSVRLLDVASTSLRVSLLSVDGASLVTRVFPIPDDNQVMWGLEADELDRIADGGQQVPRTTVPVPVRRSARMVATGSVTVDFARSFVAVPRSSTPPPSRRRGWKRC